MDFQKRLRTSAGSDIMEETDVRQGGRHDDRFALRPQRCPAPGRDRNTRRICPCHCRSRLRQDKGAPIVFAFLVNELGILPGNILCVTFTNKSANEMRQRIHILTGDNDTGYINTFHGFCVSVLRRTATPSSIPKAFWCWTTRTSTLCSKSSTRSGD